MPWSWWRPCCKLSRLLSTHWMRRRRGKHRWRFWIRQQQPVDVPMRVRLCSNLNSTINIEIGFGCSGEQSDWGVYVVDTAILSAFSSKLSQVKMGKLRTYTFRIKWNQKPSKIVIYFTRIQNKKQNAHISSTFAHTHILLFLKRWILLSQGCLPMTRRNEPEKKCVFIVIITFHKCHSF